MEDAGEPERFEPPRGPVAHVSGPFPAVGDHRPVPVEVSGRLLIERLDGQAHRAGEVFGVVAFAFPYVQEVPTGRDQLLHLVVTNLGGHGGASSSLLKTPHSTPSGA